MSRQLRVFLCHATQDKPRVRELYNLLKSEDWIDPWLDKDKILPGQDWELVIEKAVDESDVVIVCLSSQSVTKEGFVQREIRYAYDLALEKPENTIFLIPLQLDFCNVPRKLRSFHWVEFFGNTKEEAYLSLLESLKIRYTQKAKEERDAKEKTEREALEKAAREKRENEAKEKEKAEREALEKAAREKRENEAKEKAEREKRERDAKENAGRKAIEQPALAPISMPVSHIKKINRKTVPWAAVLFSSAGGLMLVILMLCIVLFLINPNLLSSLITSNTAPTSASVSTSPTRTIRPNTPAPTSKTELHNVRTALDSDGVQATSTFGAFDTVYVVSDLSNGVAGNIITSKWYAESVDGVDPNFLIDEADINVTEESFNGTIYFYFEPPTDGWPAGTYRVEVYFNGALTGTVQFSVQ